MKKNIYQAAMEYISEKDLFFSVWEAIRKCPIDQFPQRVLAFDKVCYDFHDVTYKTKKDRDYIVSLMIAATLYGVFRKEYRDFRIYAIVLDSAQTKFETFKC